MEPASNSPVGEHAAPEQGGDVDVAPAGRRILVEPSGPSAHPWDGYLTGPENELAMAAAQAMARGERQGISPLVVHGPSGVGKSRLLAGLVAERLRREPGAAVAHLDAETFGSACVEAGGDASGGWPALRDRLRGVDLFVLEDLEGLERTPSAREELAHTLDALEIAGAAVAVSAKSAPGTWPRREWPARLVNRLLGGLTTRIDPPGLASRRRYVLLRAADHGLALQAEAVERLAQTADGYRTLDGWIARLGLEARLGAIRGARGAIRPHHEVSKPPRSTRGRSPPSWPMRRHWPIRPRPSTRSPGPSPLGSASGSASCAGPAAGRRSSRLATWPSTWPGRSPAPASPPSAAYFGGRDPATVRHACKAAAERINADPGLAAVVTNLSRSWQKSDA